MSGDDALVELLGQLKRRNYHFVAVTPETHARVLARPFTTAPGLRDIFGWNRPFEEQEIEPDLLSLLRCSRSLEEAGGRLRSRVRVATLDGDLFLHSSFPTTADDAVFFGPDTYRFARFVRSQLPRLRPPSHIVDMGSGTGTGGIISARHVPAARLTLVDVNPEACRLAGLNARFAQVAAEVMLGERIPEGCDLMIANPPYMIDAAGRIYRDGGLMFGGEVAWEWARQGIGALRSGGSLLLYTGAAVVAGELPLLGRILAFSAQAGLEVQVDEIDPDVFGAELEAPGYEEVERIAVLGITITKF